ncbi:MAG: mismatch repair protein MutL protein [candidate division TM6 bacterium GW2011_GWF2_32_72]|nr:MAG: mismatch repair protein MutL protein [candidate division TM6 bacterium GW2011_GWF2_32_72]
MSKIRKLSDSEARKIAAGEVVERPANVVKELVENSIDAGATQISIYLEDGGKTLIRIIDNGCGMGVDDARMCFEHHATSKISVVEDLESISTFGFRGEALSSISAVSQITLITKEDGAQTGLKMVLDGGKETEFAECAASNGTDFTIKNLFFNVPARKKFLKKKETEWRQILSLFQAFCLDYLHIHFKLHSEGKLIHNCPVVSDLKSRVVQLWDSNFSANLIEVSEKDSKAGVSVFGLASNHQYFRYDRGQIFFFVNKRWVKNQKLSNALIKAYLNVAPPARFPAAFLFVELDQALVDVNIHPRKEEVQFFNPRKIELLIQVAVRQALEDQLSSVLKKNVSLEYLKVERGHEVGFANLDLKRAPFDLINTFSFDSDPFEKINSIQNERLETFSDDLNRFDKQDVVKHESTENLLNLNSESFSISSQPDFILNETNRVVLKNRDDQSFAILNQVFNKRDLDQQQIIQMGEKQILAERDYELIGQYKKTYILLEKEEGLFFVDQHAAHERVLYEQYVQRFENVPTVGLLFPKIIKLSAQDLSLIEENLDLFNKHGIELELFGEGQIVVKATPIDTQKICIEELVKQVIGWIIEYNDLDEKDFFKAVHEKVHAKMSCAAAVKAGDELNREQMFKLLDDLSQTSNKITCPHGRPTGWLLAFSEIEKKFKRDYRN